MLPLLLRQPFLPQRLRRVRGTRRGPRFSTASIVAVAAFVSWSKAERFIGMSLVSRSGTLSVGVGWILDPSQHPACFS